jgi:hypothetical protein
LKFGILGTMPTRIPTLLMPDPRKDDHILDERTHSVLPKDIKHDIRGILTSCFFYFVAILLAYCGLKVAFWKADREAAKTALLLLSSAIAVIFAREALALVPGIKHLKVLDKIEVDIDELKKRAAGSRFFGQRPSADQCRL